MKWLSATNSFPRTFHSKPFYSSDSQRKTNANQYTDPPHPFGLYSVTRVNPLYIEEVTGGVPQPLPNLQHQDTGVDCSLTGCRAEYLHSSSLREDTVSVLKQDTDFIHSILVSVRLGRCHKRNGLAPIPEGKVDCVPRPIWPQDESIDARYEEARIPKPPTNHKHKRWKHDKKCPTGHTMVFEKQKSFPEILRELSASINNAMENADRVEIPPEAVLRSLREKINKCLNHTISPELANASDRSVLGDNAVATLSRAFSFVNSFNDGSHGDDIETGRLLLLKRLGKFPPSEPYYEHVQRSSSSSSSGASTSGFSDLTHTPASSNSSASDSPPVSRTVEGSEAPPSYAHSENALVAACCGDKSALKNNCDNANVKSTVSFSSFQYRIIQNQTNFPEGASRSGSTTTFTRETKAIGALAETNTYEKSDTLLSSYPGHRCPDFTLDVQQAEKVMKKIQDRKKERCWCRVVTSFVGFVFLLFSVMFFSMMLSKGERMFGSM